MAARLRLKLPSWPVACGALGLLSALLFLHDAVRGPAAAWAPALEWQAQRLGAEPWRLLSAALVHYDARHLAANLAGCAVVALFGHAARLPVRATLAAGLAGALAHALLMGVPGLSRYGGLSGVLHAAVAVAGLHLALQARGGPRLIGALVWSGLLLKVLLEAPWRGAVQPLPGWSFPVAVGAHAAGLFSGTVVVGCMVVASRWHAGRRGTARQ